MVPGNDNSATLAALRESWGLGYQQAVDTLREMAVEFGDEQIQRAIKDLADVLERVKP